MNNNKSIVTKKACKTKQKPKYRFYEIGTYGSLAKPNTLAILIQDMDSDTYFLYRNSGTTKIVKKDEIIKYSMGDGYSQHYKLHEKKKYKPMIFENNKFLYVNTRIKN
jgi:hypothetical protein